MEWWEEATLIEVNKDSESIVFECPSLGDIPNEDIEDEDDDLEDQPAVTSEFPSIQFPPKNGPPGYRTKADLEDFLFAPHRKHTLHTTNLSFFRSTFVLRDEAVTMWKDGSEHIVMGCNSYSKLPSTRRKVLNYCLATDEWKIWRQDEVNKEQQHCLSAIGSVSQTLFSNHECKDLHKVYCPRTNSLHILVEDKCHHQIVHCQMDLEAMRVQLLPSLGAIGRCLSFSKGQMVYVFRSNSLFYFGDHHEYQRHAIWTYDLDGSINGKVVWKPYPLTLPKHERGEFTVVAAGDVGVFIFYFESRSIYLYDISAVKAYALTKKYPTPFSGRSIGIKSSSNHIHFFNAAESVKDLKVLNRPYHFKVDIEELIPIKVRKTMHKRQSRLIRAYVHQTGLSKSLTRYLKGIITSFYPVFL